MVSVPYLFKLNPLCFLMNPADVELPEKLKEVFSKEGILQFRPAQEKAIQAGLLEGKNLLICTPTASGKTLIAELASGKTILEQHKKAVYIVPLIALANDKHKDFTRKYQHTFRVTQSSGDLDTSDKYLADYDLIICTAEKLDSLTRHHASWLTQIGCVILDEIHLLNDTERGPTLEILITLLRQITPHAQIIGLSATIGNPQELAAWLEATLVQDTWRPVPLHKGVYCNGIIQFELENSNAPEQTKP